jgi:hypothetical protein
LTIHTEWEKIESIPSKIRNEALLSPLLLNKSGFLARETRKEKEIKEIQIGKKEVKLSLFADDWILYYS